MRDVTINNLDDRSIGKLRRLIRDGRGDETPPRQPAPVRDQQGAEHLLFEIPAAGIDAFTGTTVDSADCVTYRILSDGTLQSVPGRRTLHNLRSSPLVQGERVLGHRDAWGLYVAVDAACVDDSEVVIETWVPNGAQTKLMQVNNSLTLSMEGGCVKLNLETLGTGEDVPLCCEPESCSEESAVNEVVLRQDCFKKSPYFEVRSLTVSPTTVTDGDTITLEAVWGMRDDYTAWDSYTPQCCYAQGNCFRPRFKVRAWGAVLTPLTSDLDEPACIFRDQDYHGSATYRVDFTRKCLGPPIAIELSFILDPGCGGIMELDLAGDAWGMLLLSSEVPTGDICDGVVDPAPGTQVSPCPDEGSSGSGSSGSGGGGPSSKSSRPSVVDPGSGLGGGLWP